MKWIRQYVSTERGVFEIFISGDGSPVCITHNYSEFNETGDAFAETFTDNHKVILVNLRETGNSAKATEPYQLSIIEAVLDLDEIRKELGYNKWSFAGHSTGGMIGVLYGIHFSNSLKSLILVGTSAREYTLSSKDCIYNAKHPKNQRMIELISLLKSGTLTEIEKEKLTEERTKFSLYNPNKYNEYFSFNIKKEMSTKRLDFFNRELSIFDVTRQLDRITTNTLIICGRYDVQCPIQYSIEMSKLIPNNKLVIFEESNHYPFLEEKEKFKDSILCIVS
ncbi:alpha/beta fold hydrolase [Rummeliibacillus sp. NPDC094406]|uniref:alpha/beta fold hydrolase n=1 Tax=Rummeliibacillus sp. NPDC094406 TaxID=3364511 RepID=UPI00380E00DC